jgi:hypothetical protein
MILSLSVLLGVLAPTTARAFELSHYSPAMFNMNDYFLPLGTIRYTEIYRRIVYSNPALEIEPLSIRKLDDVTLVTGTVEGRTIRDVVLIDRSAERNRRIITARTARLEERERGVVSLVLDGVFTQVSAPKEGDRYDYTTSSEMVYNVSLKSVAASSAPRAPPSRAPSTCGARSPRSPPPNGISSLLWISFTTTDTISPVSAIMSRKSRYAQYDLDHGELRVVVGVDVLVPETARL